MLRAFALAHPRTSHVCRASSLSPQKLGIKKLYTLWQVWLHQLWNWHGLIHSPWMSLHPTDNQLLLQDADIPVESWWLEVFLCTVWKGCYDAYVRGCRITSASGRILLTCFTDIVDFRYHVSKLRYLRKQDWTALYGLQTILPVPARSLEPSETVDKKWAWCKSAIKDQVHQAYSDFCLYRLGTCWSWAVHVQQEHCEHMQNAWTML